MTNAPMLSVITISYNDVDGLGATIDSVRSQDYPAIEHIVIDGGSGKAAVDLLSASGVAYWQSQPDAGRYDGMNCGVEHASGDVLWFLHSGDCFADSTSASTGMSLLTEAGPVRAQWGYGRVRLTGDSDRAGLVWGYIPFDLRRFSLGTEPIPHQASMFGADLFEAVGPYSVDFGLAADQLLMLAAGWRVLPVTTPDVLCHFDAGGAGSVRSQREHYHDVRRAWDVVGYFPLRSKPLSVAYSKVVEWTASGKALVRERVSS